MGIRHQLLITWAPAMDDRPDDRDDQLSVPNEGLSECEEGRGVNRKVGRMEPCESVCNASESSKWRHRFWVELIWG